MLYNYDIIVNNNSNVNNSDNFNSFTTISPDQTENGFWLADKLATDYSKQSFMSYMKQAKTLFKQLKHKLAAKQFAI